MEGRNLGLLGRIEQHKIHQRCSASPREVQLALRKPRVRRFLCLGDEGERSAGLGQEVARFGWVRGKGFWLGTKH